CPIIALEAVVTRDENNARAGGVQIYGVDEGFWKFHGANIRAPEGNDVLVSEALARELGSKQGDTLVLRIGKPSTVPAESLHGRKDDLGRTVRLTMREALPTASLGEFSLRPQQGAVRAVFVELKKLQKNLEQDGKANAILLAAKHTESQSSRLASQILKDKFTLADLGLKLRTLEQHQAISLESESALINDTLADVIYAMPNTAHLKTTPVLTYLANTIRLGAREIPYSLITALDWQSMPEMADTEISGADVVTPLPDGRLSHDQVTLGRTINGSRIFIRSQTNEYPAFIVLNNWAAEDLGAKVNDDLEIEYYLWEQEGRLVTKTARLRVAAIAPMQGVAADRNFAPDYPGITDTDSLADWDPPFPIELNRVRPKDEDYWRQYRTTPKAFIPIAAGTRLWGSRYGKLTSMRFTPKDPSDLPGTRDTFEKQLRASLDPVQMGLAVQSVKEQILQSSRGATDFGVYFTYFSLFLVVSALLLAALFFKLGVEQRLSEIGLLRAIGFSIQHVRSLFLREGLALAVIGSLAGVIGAIAYGGLMMFGLRTWWVGAVGTTLLELHITPLSLLIGALSGVVTALVCVWWTLRSLRASSPRSLLAGSIENIGVRSSGFSRLFRLRKLPPKGGTPNAGTPNAGIPNAGRAPKAAIIFGALGTALMIAAASKLIGQVGGFFGAGTLLLIAILFFWSGWLRSDKKRTIQGQGVWPMARMGFRNATTRPGRSVLCIALIASAAFIIVSVDAFRRDGKAAALDKKSGNGGYPLMAESLLPIVHDPNSEQGREELSLDDDKLAGVRVTRFRLRPGDDASCLNLYQPRNPRILGVSDGFIGESRFEFQSSLAKTSEQKTNPWSLLNANIGDDVIPVAADAKSLEYVLHLNLGDEMTVNASNGAPVRL
ncbi:MAG TPA: ABC transporter permease, partial [Blastocatellia bacterium]|nr:ABC transporter permease [Blastocatellia bacterium]